MKYSVVIPFKDEEENITPLLSELYHAMESIQSSWELICIDDGSKDKTADILKKEQKEKQNLTLITFERNFGQTSAFDAGFKHAKGEFVITLDGDGQNAPFDIPKLVELADNYDLVSGVRVKREDTFLKRCISKVANLIRGKILQDHTKDTGCSLKVYRRSCLNKIKLFDGMHRFLPALFVIEGYSIIEVPVNHRKRKKGKTKYTLLNRSFNTIFDLVAVYWMRKRALKYRKCV